jgi:hypothetical protein
MVLFGAVAKALEKVGLRPSQVSPRSHAWRRGGGCRPLSDACWVSSCCRGRLAFDGYLARELGKMDPIWRP